MSELIHAVTVESFRELMLASGYRAEVVKDPLISTPFLRSATNGLSFDVRMGNKLPGNDEAYSDLVMVAVFNIVGELPLAPVNGWNNSRRFGRLQIDASIPDRSFLVLCMDILVAGGITRQHLRGQIEIWDGLVQQLVPWLREELGKLRPVDAIQQTVAAAPPPAGGQEQVRELAAGA
jgi:hypothetical protein